MTLTKDILSNAEFFLKKTKKTCWHGCSFIEGVAFDQCTLPSTYWRKLEKTIPSGFPLLTNFRKSRSLTGNCGGSNQESNFQTTKKGWLNDSCCGAKRCW